MATGTIRYWAAARAAAGVADEPYEANTLAEVLDAVVTVHGEELARVIKGCSFLVDEQPVGKRPHSDVTLSEGGSIEVLPPFAGGSGAPVAPPTGAHATSPLHIFATGLGAAVVAGALAGLAVLHIGALAAGVFVVQVVVALAWLAAVDVPGGGGAFVIVVIASGVMDGLVGTSNAPDIGRASGVAAIAVVVSLLHQLARRPRVNVTLSFAGTIAAVCFALAAASYVALSVEKGGDTADVAALLGAGVALVIARLADLALSRPAAVPGSRRGVVGLVLGFAFAALVGWTYGSHHDVLGAARGFRLAVVTAVIALVTDLAVDGVLRGAPPSDARARSGVPPLGILLPVVLAAPAAYVAGRILLG